jgi:O-methyltransferase involved in polyketide biosynthesis
MQRYRSALGQPDSAESGNLVYEEERTEVVDWLTEHNWDITAVAAEDLMANNGRYAATDLDFPPRRVCSLRVG